nr:protein TAPETUM DETERMINANT 1-like isoform X2 [Physcomitrium patens]|eukprot:XP_024403645.1 protein TAPETUM DETERMINANT 1-like isoform X2 [Physcomitrella patens]
MQPILVLDLHSPTPRGDVPSADMSAMILVIRVPFQPRKLLPFSLSFFLFFALPFFTCADPSSGLRSVKEVVDVNWNGPRPLSDSSPFTDTTPGANRRSVNYRNRRLLDGEMCTKFDISIFQGPGSPLPNGIPTFSVQIFNLCTVGCPISNVHVACGWFASAKLVNPKVFRRVKYNDCLVNDGNPIPYGDSITFQYANSFAYQLKVETAVTCKWP